jgi:hypothetical protein
LVPTSAAISWLTLRLVSIIFAGSERTQTNQTSFYEDWLSGMCAEEKENLMYTDKAVTFEFITCYGRNTHVEINHLITPCTICTGIKQKGNFISLPVYQAQLFYYCNKT